MKHWAKLLVQLIAVLSACVAFVYGAFLLQGYGYEHWLPDADTARIVLFTTVTFAAVISEFKGSRRNWRFWAYLSGLCVVHCLVFVLLLVLWPHWPLLVFAVVALVEIPWVCRALDALGFVSTGQPIPWRR